MIKVQICASSVIKGKPNGAGDQSNVLQSDQIDQSELDLEMSWRNTHSHGRQTYNVKDATQL